MFGRGKAGGAGGRRALLPEREVSSHPLFSSCRRRRQNRKSRGCRRAASPPAGARGVLASPLFLLPPQAAKPEKQGVQEGGEPSCRSARCPRIPSFPPAAAGGKTGKAGGAGGRRALLPEREVSSHPLFSSCRRRWQNRKSRWCRRAASPPAGARGVLASPLFLLPPQAAKQAIRVNQKTLVSTKKRRRT